MIDIHSHLIHGVDDGASSIDESLRMVSEAEKLGIKVIIATPHFQEPLFCMEKVRENYHELVEKVSNYDVTIKLGSEIYINQSIPKKVEQNTSNLTLNESRYMLLELPPNVIPVFCLDVIYRLQVKKITLVISHPERNRNFLRDYNKLIPLVERGCLVQIDAASILGVYGNSVKNFAKQLIKLNMVHFVASNAHCAEDYVNWYQKAYNRVRDWAGEDYCDKLFFSNAKVVLDNAQESMYHMI